jgi:hypothetical protein
MLDPLLLGGRGMTRGSISVGSRADFEAINRAIARIGRGPRLIGYSRSRMPERVNDCETAGLLI